MKRNGFTLIELSIVVLIISLIIGTIVVSQSMMRTAQLKSIVEEAQRYTRAIADFRDKYQALPGDMSNATGYWGAAACPGGTFTSTCDGDGNGRITSQNNATAPEQFRAWQHLSFAKMIDGTFSGTAGTAGNWDRVAGTNVPDSGLKGGGWGLVTMTISDLGGMPDIPYVAGDTPPNVVLWFGGRSLTGANNRQQPLLTPEEAKQLDQKVDDGMTRVGKIVAQTDPGVAPFCYNGNDYYNTTETRQACTLVFKTGF